MKSTPVRLGCQPYLVDRFYGEQDDERFALLADLSGLGWAPMSADLQVLLQMHGVCRRCGKDVDLFADHVTCAPGVDWWGDRVALWVPVAIRAQLRRATKRA